MFNLIDDAGWKELLNELELFPPFYSPDWLKIYARLRPNYTYGAFKINCPNAVYLFPFITSRVLVFKALYSGPLGTYGGPVLIRGEASTACLREFIRGIVPKYLRFVVNLEPFNSIDPSVFRGLKIHRGFTHILNLKKGEVLSESFLRGAKKAVREGVEVGKNVHVEYFLDKLFERKEWLDKRLQGQAGFFRELIASGIATLYTAIYRGKPIAHVFLLKGKRYAFYHYGVSDREYLGLRPNNLLHWRIVEELKEEGFYIYNLGSSVGLPGVEEFKRRMGASKYETLSFTRKII